jgi:hypothetical protein
MKRNRWIFLICLFAPSLGGAEKGHPPCLGDFLSYYAERKKNELVESVGERPILIIPPEDVTFGFYRVPERSYANQGRKTFRDLEVGVVSIRTEVKLVANALCMFEVPVPRNYQNIHHIFFNGYTFSNWTQGENYSSTGVITFKRDHHQTFFLFKFADGILGREYGSWNANLQVPSGPSAGPLLRENGTEIELVPSPISVGPEDAERVFQ